MKIHLIMIITVGLSATACDRVGSEAWCEKQRNKPKTEWTLQEAGDFTKYCVLGMDADKWCKQMEAKPKGDWTANELAEYTENCVLGRDVPDE